MMKREKKYQRKSKTASSRLAFFIADLLQILGGNMLEIPFYDDSAYKNIENFVYPYSDKYMVYDKSRHQYFLTEEALVEFGINTSSLKTPEELKEFIHTVTRAVYSYILVKAGKINYPFMMYRIAKGYGPQNMDKLSFRKIFLEDVLVSTARDIATNGYSKDMPKMIMNESGRVKYNQTTPIDGYWLHDDVIFTLDSLNLTSFRKIYGYIDWEQF